MRAWSSVHLFTDKTEKALRACAPDLPDAAHERDAVETWFRKYRRLRGMDLDRDPEFPLHDNDRYFIALFEKLYPDDVPAWVIQNDFQKRGLSLHIYGDLICSPGVVSAFSSRYFGGFGPEGLLFHNIGDMAREMKCPVLGHTFLLDGERAACKIYAARGTELAMMAWGMEGHENRNAALLEELFPALSALRLEACREAREASRLLCAALDLPEGGPDYGRQREETCRFLRTERLYNVYVRGTAPEQEERRKRSC